MSHSSPKSRIFISYRRDDSAGYAGRLYDDIAERVGDDRVFRDIDTIEPGQDFIAVLDDALKSVSILLVVIGPDWVSITDDKGQRRLDNPGDFVRMEVAHALSSEVRVIPVLVEDARMPRPPELPEDLQSLTRRQYHELSDSRWEYDVSKLLDAISGPAQKGSLLSRRAAIAAGTGAALIAAGGLTVWLWPSDDDPLAADLTTTPALAAGAATSGDAEFARTPDSSAATTQIARHVPLPAIVDHLIPDSETNSWDDLGQRIVRGVVLHRNLGTLVEVEELFRERERYALDDFGVGHESGQIWMWNDPTGAPHTGVSPNRAPWANGPVSNPNGDAPRFISLYGNDAINRDLVSITVTGGSDDLLSDICQQSVASLIAYCADLAGIHWSDFPHVKEDGYMFVMLHKEFNGDGICPGPALTDATLGIVNMAGELLRQYQTGT